MTCAENIMKTEVIVVTPQQRIKDVILLLGKHQISGLCVVDEASRKNILGVITEVDLLRAFKDNRTSDTVCKIMTPQVTTVTPETTLDQLIDLFLSSGLRRVFVAEGNQLEGVISRRDLVYAAQCEEQSRRFAQMSN